MIDSAVLHDDVVVEDYPAIGKDILTGVFELELIVIDSDTGRPVPGALIGIDSVNRIGTCSDVGRVFINELLVGHYVIDVIKIGYAASLLTIDVYESGAHTHVVRMQSNC